MTLGAYEDNDYHLRNGSSCVDAGANYYWFPWPQRDMDGNCRLVGERVDMGCYEYGSSRDSDGDLVSDEGESAAGTDPEQGDTDGDGVRDGPEVLRGTDPVARTAPRTVHVPSDLPTIQEALCLAVPGDEIVVAPGTYTVNIHFCGADVVLRGWDPEGPDILASTVLEGAGSGPVVAFTGSETEKCVLEGFAVRKGAAYDGGGIYGGAPGKATHATIQNNTISGNTATGFFFGAGGGVAWCDGAIHSNTITGNGAEYGGGLAYCGGLIQSNTISGNFAQYDGGGLYSCNAMIEDNNITGNNGNWGGGGLWSCHGTMQNNIISGNSGPGLCDCDGTVQNNIVSGHLGRSGLSGCDGTVQNNTIVGNSSGLTDCKGSIRNCIIWGNAGAVQVVDSSTPDYSCIQRWCGGGEGNIRFDPYFVDADNGDFHLRSWSPCIDAGHPSSPFSEEPQPNGGRINMGAYGNTPEAACKSADQDRDGLPDDWELQWFGSLVETALSDPDGDHIPNMMNYGYAWNPKVPAETLAENLTEERYYETIQVALWESDHGDEIVVHPGTYAENVWFWGKNVVLRSTDPSDADLVASTILDGKGACVVVFSETENEACVLSGFTIQNGRGGGICGGSAEQHSHATIRNNVIRSNIAGHGAGLAYCDGAVENNVITNNSALDLGGGLAYCNGTIQNNTISNCYASDLGGGLAFCGGTINGNTISGNRVNSYRGGAFYACSGTIEGNTIRGNWASDGGGLFACNGTIRGNTITGNSAWQYGGGLYNCNGTIQNNTITGNSAGEVGGGLYDCDGTIHNNTITGNSATGDGGGLAECSGTVQNNTITDNSATYYGGGVCQCKGTILNCIIWANTAPSGPQLYESSIPTYSCIQGWSGGGQGNIASEPRFVDADGPDGNPSTYQDNDYHLRPDSPCIDKGVDGDWMWSAVVTVR